MQVSKLVTDLLTEHNVRRAIDKQPFAGFNQDAVNWLRRYLNPCDDQQLVVTGIPDRETGRAYIYNKTFMISYNSSSFAAGSAFYINDSTNAIVTGNFTRTHDPEELIFIRLPYPGIVGILIEKGEYTMNVGSTLVKAPYYMKLVFDPNWTSLGMVGQTGNYDLYTTNYGIKYRMLAAGYTLSNNTSKLNLNGNFVTTVFYPHTSSEQSGDDQVGHYRTRNTISGVPLSYDSITGAGNFRVTTGDEGVYGVVGNYHPEFKYVNLDQLGTSNYLNYIFELAEGNLINMGTTISPVSPNGSEAYCFCDVNMANTHWIVDDTWVWYGMATAYKGDFTNINLSIKIANLCSILVTPVSPLNSSTVIQPPVTPELTNFAGEFTRGNLFVYPASWNSWNKVWRSIKSGWSHFLDGADVAVNAAKAAIDVLKAQRKSDDTHIKQKKAGKGGLVTVITKKPTIIEQPVKRVARKPVVRRAIRRFK